MIRLDCLDPMIMFFHLCADKRILVEVYPLVPLSRASGCLWLNCINLPQIGVKLHVTLGMSCEQHCACCGKEDGSTYRCLGCLSVKYCGKACQSKHFKKHKHACRFVAGADAPGTRLLRGEVWRAEGATRVALWRTDLEGQGLMDFQVFQEPRASLRDLRAREIPFPSLLASIFSTYATATSV